MAATLQASVFRWHPDYGIGVEEIDHDHRHLFSLAEGLAVALRESREQECLIKMLDELCDYTGYHFAHEEMLMEQIGYPHLGEHREEHESLTRQVWVMKTQAVRDDQGLPQQVMNFLVNWLKYHTMTSDRRIGTYMRKHGLVA